MTQHEGKQMMSVGANTGLEGTFIEGRNNELRFDTDSLSKSSGGNNFNQTLQHQ